MSMFVFLFFCFFSSNPALAQQANGPVQSTEFPGQPSLEQRLYENERRLEYATLQLRQAIEQAKFACEDLPKTLADQLVQIDQALKVTGLDARVKKILEADKASAESSLAQASESCEANTLRVAEAGARLQELKAQQAVLIAEQDAQRQFLTDEQLRHAAYACREKNDTLACTDPSTWWKQEKERRAAAPVPRMSFDQEATRRR